MNDKSADGSALTYRCIHRWIDGHIRTRMKGEESMKKWGRERGADYILMGVVNSITDQEKGERVIFYQIDMTLIDLEENVKVWQGQKKIKKYISTKAYKP